MINSFLKKTSWIALAVALVFSSSQMAWAAKTNTDDGSAKVSSKSKKSNSDAQLKNKIKQKIQERLQKENQANSKLLQGLQACQGKYTVTMPAIGQVMGVAYSKRKDMRGGNQCNMEVYNALKKEKNKVHPCAGEARFDPANMAAGIFNLDADVDVEHDNEYAVQDLTRMCAILGTDGDFNASAGSQCGQKWQETYDIMYKRPVRFWAGEVMTIEKIEKYACNLTKKENVEKGDTADSLNEDAFCKTQSQEKAECMNGAVSDESAVSTEEAWVQCDIECANGKQYADLFHDSDSDSEKTAAEREKEIDKAMQECYNQESWTPSTSCLTASELAPIMPTSASKVVNKKLDASDKGTGKKLGEVNQEIISEMLVTPNTIVNSNQASSKDDDQKAYKNNINSVRENQNKIKINAASRAVALGKRAVWLGTTAGEDIDNFAKKLEYSDDFLTMFKGIAELQAQHLQKTNQNTALKAKISEMSSIDGVISGHVVTTNEEALQNAENGGATGEVRGDGDGDNSSGETGTVR